MGRAGERFTRDGQQLCHWEENSTLSLALYEGKIHMTQVPSCGKNALRSSLVQQVFPGLHRVCLLSFSLYLYIKFFL